MNRSWKTVKFAEMIGNAKEVDPCGPSMAPTSGASTNRLSSMALEAKTILNQGTDQT
tara:strand:+ start:459 stop:629 length:171 start_codon:yes stop_codon:yes gene_type:complete